MHALWNLLPASGWERLAADAAWQSTLIAAGALLAARLFRRRAAIRAALLLAAAALSIAVPLLSTVVRATGTGVLPPPAAQLATKLTPQLPLNELAVPQPEIAVAPSTVSPPEVIDREAVANVPPAAAPNPVGPAKRPFFARAWPWLTSAWLAASGLLALRLLRGLMSVRRSVRSATPCQDPAILAALSRAAAVVSVRPPDVLVCPAFDTPALVAFGRPRLLVPPAMSSGVDWFAIFCHELAHLARRDGVSRLVVELCVTLLPWQPLLWLARSRFRAACEEACDDWAVAGGTDPLELASLLLNLVPTRRPAAALGMAESPATTRRRILRLVGMKRVSPPRLGRVATVLGWALAVVLGVLLAVTQFTAAKPIGSLRSSTSAARSEPPWGKEPLAAAIARAAAALPKTAGRPAPYVIEPPDVLQIAVVKLVPRSPYHIEAEDKLQVHVANPLIDQTISGIYPVEIDGEISLGAAYGNVKVSGLTLAETREAIDAQLRQVLRDPSIAVTLAEISSLPPINGQHLVAPDGTINLGTYGIVYVAGKTVGRATDAIESQLSKKLDRPQVSVDVNTYNSKTYYLVIEEPQGDQLVRVPYTGGETVLDALAKELADHKISDPADYWVWVTRPVAPAAAGSAQPGLEPASKRDVFAAIDGVVDEVLVKQGQFVKQGEILARLSNADLEKSIAEAQEGFADRHQKRRVLRTLSKEEISPEDLASLFPDGPPEAVPDEPGPGRDAKQPADGDATDTAPDEPVVMVEDMPADEPGSSPADQQSDEAPQKQLLASLEKKRERLTVTSPVDGQILTAHLEDRLLHKSVRQGEVLLTIGEAGDEELAVGVPPEQPPLAATHEQRDVFAAQDAVVDEVLAEPGQSVKRGDVVAKLHSPDLDSSIVEMRTKLLITQEKMRAAHRVENRPRNGEDTQRSQSEIAELKILESSYKEQLELLEKKKEQLVVTSPVDGQIISFLDPARLHISHSQVKQGQVPMMITESTNDKKLKQQVPVAEAAASTPPAQAQDQILPVDWQQVVEGTNTTSNWPLKSGDRIFLRQKPGR